MCHKITFQLLRLKKETLHKSMKLGFVELAEDCNFPCDLSPSLYHLNEHFKCHYHGRLGVVKLTHIHMTSLPITRFVGFTVYCIFQTTSNKPIRT